MYDPSVATKVLDVLKCLRLNVDKPVDAIASRTGMSTRNVYRLIKIFKNSGMNIRKRYSGVYTLEADVLDGYVAMYEANETTTGKMEPGVICQKPCQDLKVPRNTYEVMEQMDDEKILDDAPYLKKVVANVTLLQQAAENMQRVEITYDSNYRNRRETRVIEPYTFFFYYNYVWCFDTDRDKNTALRVSRMSTVTVLNEKSTNGNRYRKQIIDAFGCWGHCTRHVKLRLSMQAHNLMIEAHPISMITIREDTDYPDGEKWILDADVCDYSGITRYIMGMLDEVEILEGDGLKEYIKAWREKINAVAL